MSGDEWHCLMGAEIRIKTVREGSGDVASMGTVVLCNLKGYLLEQQQAQKQQEGKEVEVEMRGVMVRSLSEPVEDEKNARFVIGEGDTIPALELALRHAKKGEMLLVQTSPKFAYGTAGRSIGSINSTSRSIPGDAHLEFEVEVLDHLQLDLQRQGQQQQEKVGKEEEGKEEKEGERCRKVRCGVEREVLLRKECGNRWHSFGFFQRAGRAYSKGVEIADAYLQSVTSNGGEGGGEHEEEVATNKSILDAYVACLNNLSACHIGNCDYFKAKEVCIRVLQLEPTNIKALVRAAKASLALHDYEECEACLNKVCELEPGNALAIKEKEKLRKARKDYAASNAQMSRNMAKGLFKDEASKAKGILAALPETTSPVPTLVSPVAPASPSPTESDKSSKSGEASPEDAAVVSSPLAIEEKLPPPTTSSSNTFLFLALSVVTLLVSVCIIFFSQRSKNV